jgi:hypothetical protein
LRDGNGVGGGFLGVNFWAWWIGVFAGGFEKNDEQNVDFSWSERGF